MEHGATEFDKLCHRVFRAGRKERLLRQTGVRCGACGRELQSYYCEERLFVIRCDCCNTVALVKAQSPADAAYCTFGHALYPPYDMDGETAVFFDHVPIDELPCYVGSVLDEDFPWDDVVAGMYLPCPGTDGTEV